MTTCPPPEALDDLMANRLSPGEAERVRAHVADCPACKRQLHGPEGATPQYPFLSPGGEGDLGQLSRYHVRGVLGQGGMSVVFEAEDPVLHRHVALKVLRPEINDPVMRERFLLEARAIAGLPSEHVVHLYEVGEAEGVPFIAMERLRGEPLSARLQRDRSLPVADALRIAREAAEGLDVLQQRDLVHRDVKPENLWLTADAQGRFAAVKLIDFGIVRRVSAGAGLTMVGQVIGTPTFMAPEQAAGAAVDGRADLYSLGCVLYRMVSGRLPFGEGGADTLTVLQAVLSGAAPPVAEVAPHLRPAVALLIDELMQRDPDRRPANAAAVVARLRELEAEERTAAAQTRLIQASVAGSRRTPRPVQFVGLVLGALAVAAALVVGVVTVSQKYWSGPSTEEPDEDRKPSPVAKGEPIKVGVLFSQKGTTREHEGPVLEAVELAVEEINKGGGVLGRTVEAVVGDGASDENRFADEARRLAGKGVAVIFGCWSSSARRRVTEVCKEKDLLLFYPSSDEGMEESPNLVYLGGTPNQTLIPLIKYLYAASDVAKKVKGRRSFFLVGSESVYSHAANAIVEHEVEHLGGKVVGKRYLLLGADKTDALPVAKQIEESGADCVIVSIDGVASNEALLRAMRERKLSPPAVMSAWLSLGESELQRLPEDLEGDYSAACYFESLDTKANRDFVARFRKKYGPTRRVSDAMQAAYAGVYLWKAAAERAGRTDTAAVRRALKGLTIEAPDGPLKMADNLHAYQTARVGRVEHKGDRVDFRVVYQSPEPVPPEPFPPWRTEPEWREMLKGLYDGWGGAWGKSK